VAWRWAKAKIDKESFALLKETVNIPKEDMEDYHWVMFTHAMEFFQECASLKKPIQEHFFTSLLQDLLTEDLVSLGNLLSTKFMKPGKQLYATPSKQAWVPQYLKNKVLKQPMNRQMIGLALKSKDVYNSKKKKNIPAIEGETKMPFFAVIFGSLDVLI
jgi:hypothetical protein